MIGRTPPHALVLPEAERRKLPPPVWIPASPIPVNRRPLPAVPKNPQCSLDCRLERTAILSGANGGTGVGLVEVFEVK